MFRKSEAGSGGTRASEAAPPPNRHEPGRGGRRPGRLRTLGPPVRLDRPAACGLTGARTVRIQKHPELTRERETHCDCLYRTTRADRDIAFYFAAAARAGRCGPERFRRRNPARYDPGDPGSGAVAVHSGASSGHVASPGVVAAAARRPPPCAVCLRRQTPPLLPRGHRTDRSRRCPPSGPRPVHRPGPRCSPTPPRPAAWPGPHRFPPTQHLNRAPFSLVQLVNTFGVAIFPRRSVDMAAPDFRAQPYPLFCER